MQWKKIIIVMAAILIPMAFPVNLIIKDIFAKPIVQPVASNSQTPQTYSTEYQAEESRHKAVIDKINKKYDTQLKALQYKIQGYTDKGETDTTAYSDCVSDHLILLDKNLVASIQEDIKHTQNTKKINDKYSRPLSN